MKSSATLEINTFEWHIARCVEGNCDRERLSGEKYVMLVKRCQIDACPIGHSNIEHEILMHVLGNTCPRNPSRL